MIYDIIIVKCFSSLYICIKNVKEMVIDINKMTKLLKYISNDNLSVFSYSGNVSCLYHSGMNVPKEFDEIFVEVYDKSRFPQKILCEILIDANRKTGTGKFYDCDKEIIPGMYKSFNIIWEDANYIYDRNRWLIDVSIFKETVIMRIDDEHDTYDGQFVYHERIFVDNVLTNVKHYLKNETKIESLSKYRSCHSTCNP